MVGGRNRWQRPKARWLANTAIQCIRPRVKRTFKTVAALLRSHCGPRQALKHAPLAMESLHGVRCCLNISGGKNQRVDAVNKLAFSTQALKTGYDRHRPVRHSLTGRDRHSFPTGKM